MESKVPKQSWWRRRNWWKIGFFVALLAFEVAREWAVVASTQEPYPSITARVVRAGDFIFAQGSWKRIDGGSDLMPTAISIECFGRDQRCIEMSVGWNNMAIYAPYPSNYDAKFTPDGVTYQDTEPTCVTYSVRIDTRLQKVIAVRERKKDAPKGCGAMEQRIEMTLASTYGPNRAELDKHFAPLFRLFIGALKLVS